jgi:DNA-binding NarL/FixJ family response regulator
MCSDYIDGLDRYRSSLRKTGKEGGDVMAALKSKAFMEAQLEEFYTQFDATFLDLFPDFIPQVNELLQEDKRINCKHKERLLSTELRVLALIRLGVNDSVRIAQFLRRSVSTIYNYRVKMRNAANVDREEFESRLMKIGKRL